MNHFDLIKLRKMFILEFWMIYIQNTGLIFIGKLQTFRKRLGASSFEHLNLVIVQIKTFILGRASDVRGFTLCIRFFIKCFLSKHELQTSKYNFGLPRLHLKKYTFEF